MIYRIFLLLIFPLSILAQHSPNASVQTNNAVEFIKTLNKDQKAKSTFPFDEMNRYSWHFVPSTMSARDGISMRDMSPIQKKKLNELLHVFLSEKGYNKTQGIMSLEYVLKVLEPTNDHRVLENYYVAFYGEPGYDKVWGWKFGGHHIALNFTMIDDKLAFAPFFFGANPGDVKDGPKKGYRALKNEEDLGFALLNALNVDQRKEVIFESTAFADNVTTNVPQVNPLQEVGIAAQSMTTDQKIILENLIASYLEAMPEKIALFRKNKIQKEDFENIRFGWAGETRIGAPHYYRVQGKTFLIEFDNTQNNANHIHTVWRDFNGADYGLDLIRDHYMQGPHKH
jgi:hypothetical protein